MSNAFSVQLAHHHTAICVSHWETSVAFYKELGFEVENDWYWPDGVKNHKSLLRLKKQQDCWLELFEYPEGKGSLTEDFTKSAGCVYRFTLEVTDDWAVNLLYDHALLSGGTGVKAPHEVKLWGVDRVWRMREATVAGPDGEHICFIYDRGELNELG